MLLLSAQKQLMWSKELQVCVKVMRTQSKRPVLTVTANLFDASCNAEDASRQCIRKSDVYLKDIQSGQRFPGMYCVVKGKS